MAKIIDKKDSDLEKELKEARISLRKFRFDISGSRIKNVKTARGLKKTIARVLTEMRRRQNA